MSTAIKRYVEFDFGKSHKTAFTPDFFLFLLENCPVKDKDKLTYKNADVVFTPHKEVENHCEYENSDILTKIEYFGGRGFNTTLENYLDDAIVLKSVFEKLEVLHEEEFKQFKRKLNYKLEKVPEDDETVVKILFSFYLVWDSLKNNPQTLKHILYEAFHIRTEPVLQIKQRQYTNRGLGDNQYQIGKIIIGGKRSYYSPLLEIDFYYKDNLKIEFREEQFRFYFDNSDNIQKKLFDITGRKRQHILHMQDEKEYQNHLFKNNFLLFEVESAVSSYGIMSFGKNISLYLFGAESIFGPGFRHEIATFDKDAGLKEESIVFEDNRFITIQNHKTLQGSNSENIHLHIRLQFDLSYTETELKIIKREEVITVNSKEYALKNHDTNKAKINWLTDLLITYDIEQEKSFFIENTLIETINL